MAKFSKMQVMAAMKATGMVPVFFNKDIEICKNVIILGIFKQLVIQTVA